MLKKLTLLLWIAVIVSGCATMEGLGKDLGALGDKIEDAASK